MVGARGLERGSAAVHVIVIHNITDPEGLGAAGKADSGQIPSSMTFLGTRKAPSGSPTPASPIIENQHSRLVPADVR